MAAKMIVILGGGVGGLVAANELRRLVHPEHRIVLIEKNRQHAFAPSFLWLMTGDRQPAQISRPVRDLVRPGVELMQAEARSIAKAEDWSATEAEIQQAADARADAALSDARTRADELQQKRRVQMDGELAKHQVQLNEIDAAVKAGKAEITAMQQKQGKLTEELAALEQKLKAAKEAARKVLA